jgi:hypothetical protein
MSNFLRSGEGKDLSLTPGQSIAISTITGTVTADVIAGTAKGTNLLSASTSGGTFGPYASGAVIRVVAGEGANVDYDIGTAPVNSYDQNAKYAFDTTGQAVGLVDPVRGGVIPIPSVGSGAQILQSGQPCGITKYVTRVGNMFRDFSAGILGTVSAAASTVTNHTGYDGSSIAQSVQSKTGLPSITKIDITSDTNQQFEITSANLGSVTTLGLIGLWVYIDLTNKVGGSAARIFMDVSNQTALFSTYVRAAFIGPNQLRHGWNFLVYKQLTDIASTPGSLSHFSGLDVTKFSTGANGDMIGSPLRYMQLSFINCNGCSVYLDSLWTDFAALPQFVLGTDQATQDCVDYALPIFKSYGWKGYAAGTFRVWSSGSYSINNWNVPAGGTEKLEELYAAGWDAVNHSTNHLNVVSAALTAPQIRYEVQASRSWLLSRGAVRGSEFYASPQSSTNILSERIISEAGFKLQRHGLNGKPNIQITHFGIDNINSVGSIDMSNASVGFQKFSLIKAYIDTCIAYKASLFLFWHGITTLGDTGSGEDLTGNDLQITKSAFEKTCAYIKQLQSAGSLNVADGITGFYYGVKQ